MECQKLVLYKRCPGGEEMGWMSALIQKKTSELIEGSTAKKIQRPLHSCCSRYWPDRSTWAPQSFFLVYL